MTIQVAMKKVDSKNHFFVFVTDVTDLLEAGLNKMQNKFQTLLTNGLSHERLGPLNSSLNITEIIVNKCDEILEANNVQPAGFWSEPAYPPEIKISPLLPPERKAL